MATLIQSKQIEGVVTASVIQGDFEVGGGGSVNLSGASGVTGSFTGTYVGDGSALNFDGTGIISGSSQLIPTFDGLYLAINGDGVVSSSAQLYTDLDTRYIQSETDSQILSVSGNQLTITNGNTVTIPTGSALPSGVISGSSQITITESQISDLQSYLTSDDQTLSFNSANKQLTISEGNSVDLSSLGGGGGGGSSIWNVSAGKYRVSANLSVTGSLEATSLTGSLSYSHLINIPNGLVSSSIQITGGSNIVSGSVLRTLDGTGVISGSVLRTLDGTGVISGSVLRTLDGTGVISGSVLRTLDGTGVVSGSSQITDGSNIVSGSVLRTLGGTDVVSGSVIRTFNGTGILSGSKTDISSLNTYTSSADSRLASIEAATGSYLTSETDSQTLSISGDQLTISTGNTVTIPTGSTLPSGVVSGSSQITDGSGIFSSSAQLPSGIVSQSAQTIANLSGTNIFSGSLIPGSNVTITSGSGNITITAANDGTSDYNNLINVPSGIVSGSTQITDGSSIVSGSVLRTLDGTTVLSGSIVDQLPDGVVSGSTQITDGSNIVSGSVLRTLDGTGVVSGSVLRTLDGTNVVSGSVIRTLDGTTVLSGSFIDKLPSGVTSGSYSSSVDSRILTEKSRIDNILDGANADYDQFVEIVNLVNSTDTENDTAFANHYTSSRQRLSSVEAFTSSIDTNIKSKLNSDDVLSGSIESVLPSGVVSGSTQITDGSNIISGSVLRTLDGTGVISGSVLRTLDGTGVVSGSSQITDGSNIVSGSVLRNLDGTGVISGSVLRTLDGTNVFSGSLIQGSNITITSGSGNITINSSGGGSSDFTTLTNVPSGLVSGSSQITDGTNIVSGSVLRSLGGTNVVSGSVLRNLDGTGVVSGSVLRTLDGTTVLSGSIVSQLPDGVISGSTQITDGSNIVSGSVVRTLEGTGVLSGSISAGEGITINSVGGVRTISSSFDGNRTVSNTDLPSGIYNNNFETSGSVQDFLNKVFFPNTVPSITTGNQTIEEYTADGSTIVTIAGTDAEGQTLTFGTASSYSDDLVRVASNGVLTLNALAESSSFNTDLVGGVYGHTFTATATDTFNASVEKDITIFVTPNEAPKFREGSVGGNVITSVTSNLNENSTNNTLVKRIFFTDAESDTITITTSSIDNEHFDVTIYSNYLDIRQNTGSLDYEDQTQYTFSITASDEHYENSQDSDSRTFLPITINVTDNLAPTLSNQQVSGLNENSSNGASAGSISATDNESDAISFVSFNLHKLLLDGSTVTSGSYGGTSQATDPHENPFQMDSSGNVTRKVGVLLNSDLINEYQYRVKIRDTFNQTISSASVVGVPISDDTAATLSDNWSAGPYIKESEESGATIKTTNYGSTQADYNSNQSGTWSSSNSAISINSNGNLSLGVDLSGSVTQSGDTLDSTITFTNTFGTTTTDSLSLTIVANSAPTATFSNQTSNLNANLATTNTNLVLVGISDTEGDTPYSASLSGTDASKLNLDYQNSNSSSVYIRANEDLSASTLTYNIKVTDSYSKSTTYSNQTITIAAADDGTLGGDTTSYIIESGEDGDSIRDASGFGAGNQSQMTVSYSPNYGSQVVQGSSWTSSNSAIAINTSGQLSLATDISGSTTGSGDDIVSTIGFQDQYGNAGSGTVTVNVFANSAPTATFTDQSSNFETDNAITGTTMVSMSISDTESDTPFSASLTGTDASSLQLKYVNATSSSVGIQASTNLSAATYNYNVKVTDNFDKSTTYSGRSFTVATSADYGKVYVYDSGYNNATYNTSIGINSEDSSTPPVATPYSDIGFIDQIINDDVLGDSSFTYSFGGTQTASKLAEGTGANVHDVLRGMGSSGVISRTNSNHFIIIFPSTSDMGGIPTTTTDSYGGSVEGEFVLEVGTDGTTIDGSNTLESSEINQVTLATAHLGYTNWYVVGATNQIASSTNFNLGLNPASGSGGA